MKKLLILIVAVVFMAGCESKDTSVLAEGSGVKITKEVFKERVKRLPEWAKSRFQTEEGKKNFLKELIKEELLFLEAKKQGLNKEPEIVAKLEEFERMTLINLLLKKEIEEKGTPSEEEIREYFDKNPDEFKIGSGIRAKHILVETKEEVEDILKRIQKGESFSNLAKKLSKDPGSAKNGGDLGFFGPGTMLPEFEKVAFNLKIGAISNPVKTQFGYHIIQVTEKKEGKLKVFEEVKEEVKKRLTINKQRDLFTSFIERIEKENKVNINEEAFKSLTSETEKPEAGLTFEPRGQLKAE